VQMILFSVSVTEAEADVSSWERIDRRSGRGQQETAASFGATFLIDIVNVMGLVICWYFSKLSRQHCCRLGYLWLFYQTLLSTTYFNIRCLKK